MSKLIKFLKNLGRAIIPRQLFKLLQPYWHGNMALLGKWYFGNPSEKIKVIGVTGTNGKSTTVNLIAKILEEADFQVGLVSTVNFKISKNEKLNDLKMTTPSGWLLQKWLAEMVNNKFDYAVLEISSQGLEQNRHLGINFDVAVFTNLTPEHIEAHGSFENYKKAKGKLFTALHKSKTTIVANADDEHFQYFINFAATEHVSFGINNSSANLVATNITTSPQGVSFQLSNVDFKLKLKGKFDIYNSLAAIAVAKSQQIDLTTSKTALEKVQLVPGRMEIIQAQPFMVLIDYAPEPYSLTALYETVASWPKKHLIHVLGSTGGGRDKARRKILGNLAGQIADVVIVTNEDPYDDDPQEIINEVASGAFDVGKIAGQNLFAILDRREAISHALKIAQPGDLILITGKGSEQKMAVSNGNYIDWDDRQVAREELTSLNK
jgi:UDP-N-acetylmuramyl-tripeptide synthetase